jgi:hypothetical protein
MYEKIVMTTMHALKISPGVRGCKEHSANFILPIIGSPTNIPVV